MAQHHGETPDRSNNNIEGMQASEMVERRATSRILDEQSSVKVDTSVESPDGIRLLGLAANPERHPQGIPGFHTDSIKRLEEQNAKVAKGCTPEELMAMMNNNTYLMEAAQKRVERLLQTSQRASLAPVIAGDKLLFS
ncbi:MAG: hypothetical protein C0508_21290 [Cyanobacteria bacterium PR.023]|jgi:hypothetical protein|nr:hypothetical protein [Cyanobacteria bacterium PR.023]